MGMIDVTEKPIIRRMAEAEGKIFLSEKTIETIKRGQIKKGDPLLVAEVAGMNAAKQTHLLIPHCHQIPLDTVSLEFQFLTQGIDATCRVRAQARTGVEMEALTAVSTAALTIYDMCKAIDKEMVISDIRLMKKDGGKTGLYTREEKE